MVHYKKLHLLSDSFKKESNGNGQERESERRTEAGVDPSGINVNHSVTDQIAKLSSSKTEKSAEWSDNNGPPGYGGGSGSGVETCSSSSTISSSVSYMRGAVPANSDGLSPNKSSSSESNNNVYQRTSSDIHSGGHKADDYRPLPTREGNSSEGNKLSSSPLLFDKSKPVVPYRDPDLLKKDTEIRNLQLLHQATMTRPTGHTTGPPTTTFASVPTPIQNPHPSAMPTHSGLPQHMIPQMPYNHPLNQHLQMSGLSSIQAAAHMQAIQLQQQHERQQKSQILTSLAMHSSMQTRQLEVLWQQKYPNMQVPPGWMLQQYQDELLRDVNMMQPRDLVNMDRERLRERELAMERERMAEQDRVDRDRKDRDRLEKERQEREMREREVQERERREREERERRERDDRERREREDRERQRELERQQAEQRQRLDRERIILESAAAADAVNHHFQESLRLANQKKIGQQTAWSGGHSITKGMPKHSPHKSACVTTGQDTSSSYVQGGVNHQSAAAGGSTFTHGGQQHPQYSPREYSERHSADKGEVVGQMMARPAPTRPHLGEKGMETKLSPTGCALRETLLKGTQPGSDIKNFTPYPQQRAKDTSNTQASGPVATSAGAHSVKQEPNFCLYGYKTGTYPHTYITPDSLSAHGLKKDDGTMKMEAHNMGKHGPVGYSHVSPGVERKPNLHSPPVLVKDEGRSKINSVIVENKNKDTKPVLPPHSHGSIVLGTAIGSRPQPLPQQRQSHLSSASIQRPTLNQQTTTSNALSKSGNQSPLQVASPHQLSAAVMQPMELHSNRSAMAANMQPVTKGSHQVGIQKMPVSTTAGHAKMANVNPAGTQPSVTLPTGSSHLPPTYSLITQGLVPNPRYVAATGKAQGGGEAKGHNIDSHTGSSQHPGSPSPNSVAKRRATELNQAGKKSRLDGTGHSIQNAPVHTVSPLTTTTSSSVPVSTSDIAKNVSYFDTFRHFVEKTVTTAFRQDQQQDGQKSCSPHTDNSSPVSTTSSSSQPVVSCPQSAVATAASSVVPTNSSHVQPVPSTVTLPHTGITTFSTVTASHTMPTLSMAIPTPLSSQTLTSQSLPLTRPGPSSTPGGTSVSSNSSIMDTINRVANGLADTDSDTLSAPSPPPQLFGMGDSSVPSPQQRSGSHPKCGKKAWLQRYSHEDKYVGSPASQCSWKDDGKYDEKSDFKDSPAPALSPAPLMHQTSSHSSTKGDESTSSASETEVMAKENHVKKRPKNKKKHSGGNSSKKNKTAPTLESENSNSSVTTCGSAHHLSDPISSILPVTSTQMDIPVKLEKIEVKEEQTLKLINTDMVKVEKMEIVEHFEKEKLEKEERKKKRPSKKKERDQKKDKGEEKDLKPLKAKPKAPPTDCEVKMAKRNLERQKEGSLLRENPSILLAEKPLNQESASRLKKSQEPFLQDGSCTEITPKLMKCRECKMTPNQRNKKLPNIFCRFYAFRRLRYSSKGFLTIAGFSEPLDADADDIELWFPQTPLAEPRIDVETAKYIIKHIGDQFCDLVQQEKKAMAWVSPDTKIAWKRAVQGVREMCDVCDTTLFNMHWVCHKCGFVVCIDCFHMRMKKTGGCGDERCTSCEQEGQKWLTCSANRQQHEPDKLMITQIIPSDVLSLLGRLIHDTRDMCSIKCNCPCGRNKIEQALNPRNGLAGHLVNAMGKDKALLNGLDDHQPGDEKGMKNKLMSSLTDVNGDSMSPLSILAEAAVMDRQESGSPPVKRSKNNKADKEKKEDKDKSTCSTLRDLLTRSGGRAGGNTGTETSKKSSSSKATFDNILQKVAEKTNNPMTSPIKRVMHFEHYVPRRGLHTIMLGRDGPIPQHTLTETSLLFPDVQHSWLDNGRLLRLLDPDTSNNLSLFQQQWKHGQPVLVSNCHKNAISELWSPKSFSKEFGHLENDLVNCTANSVMVGHHMKDFWNGFECIGNRLRDGRGKPMILKLKDWPPTEDFCDLMPSRFQNLMKTLPIKEYTHRNGVFNLAGRLPDFFVKPDLGPKMYNAYGSSLHAASGSTNLHLDVSDAANVILHVGIPVDDKDEREKKASIKLVESVVQCESTLKRLKDAEEKPGALWHIFDAQDADKIRDMLNKVAKERGEDIEPHHDPIHDQSWYLDQGLRKRLLEEYDVQGYTILQFLGDAVFIPAGAPHQVQNLHSCIKCAEDFVSPENISHCFRMTQEFRNLSHTHSNHEDKLQIKNVIYHAAKDAVALLQQADH